MAHEQRLTVAIVTGKSTLVAQLLRFLLQRSTYLHRGALVMNDRATLSSERIEALAAHGK